MVGRHIAYVKTPTQIMLIGSFLHASAIASMSLALVYKNSQSRGFEIRDNGTYSSVTGSSRLDIVIIMYDIIEDTSDGGEYESVGSAAGMAFLNVEHMPQSAQGRYLLW